jgi:hypothetical protein
LVVNHSVEPYINDLPEFQLDYLEPAPLKVTTRTRPIGYDKFAVLAMATEVPLILNKAKDFRQITLDTLQAISLTRKYKE